MTSNVELDRRLAVVPNFVGTFAADRLPDLNDVPFGASLIVNHAPHDSGGVHWSAMLHLNDPTGRPPAWFDPLAFGPAGAEYRLLHVKRPHFDEYLKKAAARVGANGYRQNNIELEGITSDTCGEFSALAVLKNSLPAMPDGKIRPEWREVVFKSRRMPQKAFDRWLIARVGLRRVRHRQPKNIGAHLVFKNRSA